MSDSLCGVFAHPERETLVVTGPERLSWLNGLVTCEVTHLSVGNGAFGLALSRTGKIQSDVWLLPSAERLFISVAAGTGARMSKDLDGMLIMEDAEIEAQPGRWRWLTVHGGHAQGTASFLSSQIQAEASGQVNLLGSADWMLVVPSEAQVPAQLPDNTALGDEAAWQALRIEQGLPLFGVDYDSTCNPHDASLERRAVSWTKGCYLGQEVVCMQDMRGKAKRRLIPLKLAGAESVAAGAEVVNESGKTAGQITSSAFSPRFGCAVAMARIGSEELAQTKAAFSVAGRAAQPLLLPA